LANRLPISAILFLLLLLGILAVMTGLHDIDQGWNISYIDKTFNISLIDTSIIGTQYEANQLYNLGVLLVFCGLVISTFSAFELGRHYHA
jgi:hypothetical protein